MVRIRVRCLGAFAHFAQTRDEIRNFDVPRVGEVIDYLLEQNGEKFGSLLIDPSTGELRNNSILLLNGHRCDFDDPLSDNDEVVLLTPVSGG